MKNEEILPWQLAKKKSILKFQAMFIVYLNHLLIIIFLFLFNYNFFML